MKTSASRILVVDVEATCWDHKVDNIRSEIIEIGYALLDRESDTIGDAGHIVITPDGDVSQFCTELTGWTREALDAQGVSFKQAIAELDRRFPELRHMPWGSWGNYDRTIMKENCAHVGQRYPFGPTHVNIKHLYSIIRGKNKEYGVSKTLHLEGMKFHGRPHSGKDDAWNIACILQRILDWPRK